MLKILDQDIQGYINANLKADLHSLLLKKSPFPNVSMQDIVQQIKGKNVALKKFPFLQNQNIIFPPNINLEQASSEATATFKAANLKGESFLDLTCGFGIDAYFLSQNFSNVTLIEQNDNLLKIVEHNWKILKRKATFINNELEMFLNKNTKHFDVIYLDPARRDQHMQKKFLLEDLSPNLLDIQDQLLSFANSIIIKLSPLIDISYLLSVLKNVAEIEVIAVKNEVKELLVIIQSNVINEEVVCRCINLESNDPIFNFNILDEKNNHSVVSDILGYLYIPNNAILKAGAFHTIAKEFGLRKLHPNTHLYTSDVLKENFPGRVLKVEVVDAKKIVKNTRYNVISKNYPLSPDEIKKKYKLKDGGKDYLIFTQSKNGKIILRSITD